MHLEKNMAVFLQELTKAASLNQLPLHSYCWYLSHWWSQHNSICQKLYVKCTNVSSYLMYKRFYVYFISPGNLATTDYEITKNVYSPTSWLLEVSGSRCKIVCYSCRKPLVTKEKYIFWDQLVSGFWRLLAITNMQQKPPCKTVTAVAHSLHGRHQLCCKYLLTTR